MIFELLLPGAENAISAEELRRITGLNKRQLEAAIEKERLHGQPICASCAAPKNGYFLPANREEIETYCRTLHSRAKKIYAVRSALQKAADRMEPGTQGGTGSAILDTIRQEAAAEASPPLADPGGVGRYPNC